MNRKKIKIAIVGGGPAGLTAALAAVDNGVTDIVIIERKEKWGVPVQCAEYVPKLIGRVIDIPNEAVSTSVNEMLFYLEGKPFGKLRAPGFILNRDILEQSLAEKVSIAGAELMQPASLVKIEDEKLLIQQNEEKIEIKAQIIIGADGPRSTVRQYIGESLPLFAVGVQDRLPRGKNLSEAEIYISPRYGAGYGWAFPKKDAVNVGLALDKGGATFLRPELSNITSYIEAEEKILGRTSSRTTGGLIPVGAPAKVTVKDNVMIVGDAAGQTNPLNGAGIYNAVVCGQMAGEIAAKAIHKNDLTLLQKFEISWRDLFEKSLERAISWRQKLISCSLEEYPGLFKEAWGIKETKM